MGKEFVSMRDGFGDALVELGRKNKDVVVLTADLGESTKAVRFKEHFPERFFDVGVAEQNLVCVASGLAACGKVAFVTGYAVFSPGRNWEQIRTVVCYDDVDVKIIGSHAGISVGPDGATHQALEDVAMMRSLPNMRVIVPCDYLEAKKAVIDSAKIKGPVYIRLARDKTPVFTKIDSVFRFGKADILRDGSDVAIIACGPVVHEALLAAERLEKEGVTALVMNCHTIKPIDREAVLSAAKQCGCVLTVEDHQVTGGLGSAVSEILAEEFPVHVFRMGVPDCFGESGSPDELAEKFGLNSKGIVRRAFELVKVKGEGLFFNAPDVQGEIGRLMKMAEPEHYFHVSGGGVIRSIPELARKLERMESSVFSGHAERKDFSNWVEHVFHDKLLANLLRAHSDPKGMAQVIRRRLESAR